EYVKSREGDFWRDGAFQGEKGAKTEGVFSGERKREQMSEGRSLFKGRTEKRAEKRKGPARWMKNVKRQSVGAEARKEGTCEGGFKKNYKEDTQKKPQTE
ncbi:MAG: hypothetical protein ACI4U2_00160, partial [Christensenellaceae bacterium]